MGYQIVNELIKEVNCETGEVIERPRTAQEQAEIDKVVAQSQEELADLAAKKAKREVLLERLGITAEEASVLLG